MNKPQILIVEDDNAVANLIAATLETQDYTYKRAGNGTEAVMQALSCKPDVMLLDLGLPDMDGVEIIKKIRSWSNMPIIVVSARSEDFDKVSALDAGADDYLTKPFSVDELLARLRVALRRVRYDSDRLGEESSSYENGDLRIDYSAGCAFISEKYRQGAHSQLYSQGGLGQPHCIGRFFPACLYGNSPPQNREKLQRCAVYPNTCRHRLPYA